MSLSQQASGERSETERRHNLAGVFARGMAMGAADIVPGVSGGTIAFITGIYFRLLEAINAVPGALVGDLLRGRLKPFWHACDGTFLMCLLAGVLTSILTLASLISHVLANYPILIWSFFFGLIVASVWHVGRQVRQYRLSLLLPLVAGIILAWWITTLPASSPGASSLAFFLAGALAICAMILPGISGSFILVILGMYAPILEAIQAVNMALLLLFVAGCLVGLLSIARVITWAFHHFHDLVLALLTGFMIGALNKVWPWKQTLSWRVNSSGEQVPLNEASVSPITFAELTGQDPQVLVAGLIALAGFLMVLAVEWGGSRRQH